MEREGFQMNTIAERIKFAMKAKNKKQVDIVKDTGISKGAFSSYLSGQYNPKADKMELIADSLDEMPSLSGVEKNQRRWSR